MSPRPHGPSMSPGWSPDESRLEEALISRLEIAPGTPISELLVDLGVRYSQLDRALRALESRGIVVRNRHEELETVSLASRSGRERIREDHTRA